MTQAMCFDKIDIRMRFLLTLSVGCLTVATATDLATPAGSPERGESVYARSCTACHGDLGDGKGQAAPYLDPRPRDFTSAMFKFRSTPSGELPSDADLLRVIENGIPGSQMPAWKNLLTVGERADVVAYIKTFATDFKEGAPASVPLPEAPAATENSVREGKYVYMLMECWACHGAKGRADGQSAKTLKDDAGLPIKPWNLTREHFKAGNDPQTLYRTFSTGLNGTPMPAYDATGFLIGGDVKVDPAKYKEGYSEAEIAELTQWLQSQPKEAELQKGPEDHRQKLAEKRKWALAYYVASLVKKPNFFVRMFTENTEETR